MHSLLWLVSCCVVCGFEPLQALSNLESLENGSLSSLESLSELEVLALGTNAACSSPSTRMLWYIPRQGGLFNQLDQFFHLMHVAKHSGRALVLPVIAASKL